jgi:O-antigen ligase
MLLCAPFTLLSALGFVWAGQRASLVGVLLEILVANAALAITVRGWMRRAAVRFGLSLVVIGCVYLVAGAALTDKVKQLVRETESSMQSHTPQVMEVRLAMWKMSLIAWRRSPVAGVGYGGYHEATKDVTEVSYPEFDIKLFDTPHSTYVMILTENGVIGLALFAAWAGACLGRGLQQVRGDPARIGAFGGTVMWFGAAMFDSFHTRGVFLSVGVIVMALATMPLSDGSGSGRAAA